MSEEETPRPRGININTKAPMINTVDIYGKNIDLTTLLKTYNGVLIDFFRGNWWNHWKQHLKVLTENINEFKERKIKLISISSDSDRLLRNFKEANNFAVDMISDRGAKIAKEYDVYWFAEGASDIKVKQAVPSKFLINKNGNIVWKYVGKDKTDRPSVQMMKILMDKCINNPK